MFKKLTFRFRYRYLKWNQNPLKLAADRLATEFSISLSRNRTVDQVGRFINKGFDLKNTIDDYGREDAPEQPPYEAIEFERMKRIKRKNFLLMLAFILCEGVFNYFALQAMLPGEGIFLEIIRIATAVVISVLALYLLENSILNHFRYLMLEHKTDRTPEEQQLIVRLNSQRKSYFAASVILFLVLIALGVIREFIIAGGSTANFWIMIVTVGLAIIVAIALGLQGAEVTEIIDKYRRMVKWQQLKKQIDQTEQIIRERLDFIARQIEKNVNNQWGWLTYLKIWLRRQFDDEDKKKTDEQKQQLAYHNFGLFKEKLLSQSVATTQKVEEYEKEFKKLIEFDYTEFIQVKQ